MPPPLTTFVLCLCSALVAVLSVIYAPPRAFGGLEGGSQGSRKEAVLISYAYFEKDQIQKSNFDYFLVAGTLSPRSQEMHWVFVISTDDCSPCKALGIGESASSFTFGPDHLGVRRVAQHRNGRFTLLYRTENQGMDLGSHNVTMAYMEHVGRLRRYRYFIMINSSAKGPFVPSYMPIGWHWTHAFLERFRADVHVVASSIVCLPEIDEGGPGPRIESWAFALDELGLQAVQEAGTFARLRNCKGCKGKAGIVAAGEYGMGKTMLRLGYNMASLLSRYAQDVDWRVPAHWHCNDNVHPSRSGTYAGISMHPYETVFVKSSWHVADEFSSRYAAWRMAHIRGEPGTQGSFDDVLYQYAISPEAQESIRGFQGPDIHSVAQEWMKLKKIRGSGRGEDLKAAATK